jgi:hypothetical protein
MNRAEETPPDPKDEAKQNTDPYRRPYPIGWYPAFIEARTIRT